VVFDRHAPAEGSTAASTALVQAEIDRELGDLAKRIGAADAARAYHACVAAVGEIAALSATLGDVGFRRRACLYLASSRRHGRRLRAEAELRHEHGLEVEYLTEAEVLDRHGVPSHGALRTTAAGVVDPVQLTRRLLAKAASRGAGVVGRTLVRSVVPHGSGFLLSTDRAEYTADRVIYAMGYEAPLILKPPLVSLHSTYALVTEPLPDFGRWAEEPLLWETARPYAYLRSTDDRRLLIGGMDLDFVDAARRDRRLPAQRRRLEEQLRRWIPSVEATTAYAWAGTFAQSEDGLPFIGEVPGMPGAFAALGYGGNGILFSVIAARLLTDLIDGTPNALSRLFRLDR
jgi:glycine/D-amino acid oxidase-like deaminating enzyme